MEKKEVIKTSAMQLTIDFGSDTINCTSEENFITLDEKMTISQEKQAVVINIKDCKKIVDKKKSNKIIEYIINNAKRF